MSALAFKRSASKDRTLFFAACLQPVLFSASSCQVSVSISVIFHNHNRREEKHEEKADLLLPGRFDVHALDEGVVGHAHVLGCLARGRHARPAAVVGAEPARVLHPRAPPEPLKVQIPAAPAAL